MSNIKQNSPILIFGATGAIGKETAFLLKKNKMNIILASSKKNKNILELSKQLSSPYICFDLSKEININLLRNKIKKITNNLSGIIITIAKPFPKKLIHNTNISVLKEQLNLHIVSLHEIINVCLPFLENSKKSISRIIYISTEYLLSNPPIKIAPYLAAKSAATTYMKVLSNEVLKKNIKVFILSPGMIRSRLTIDLPEKYLIELEKSLPNNRLTEVNEISKTIIGIFKGYLDASYGSEIQVSAAERR